MKKRSVFFVYGAIALLLVAILEVGWWLAGGDGAVKPALKMPVSKNKGPIESSLCGPLAQPLPPPPVDSPFGVHLYASTPLGVVHPLPAIQIVQQLGLPEMVAKSAPKSAEPTESEVTANETGLDDVQSVSMILEEYRRAFGAMPVGELNDEIVRRLQGENPKGLAVLPKTHPAINAQGELMDRWGTPYRFHPESAWDMTVRSAGPDRRMWTNDDILTDRLEGYEFAARY
ncbi:MAG: hypothetical protein RL693_2886 [Verrucomicrobiota bacterium]